MVLGHERCGAVTAAVKGKPLPGQISSFAKAIEPAIAKLDGTEDDLVENAVVANVRYQVKKLKQSDLLTQLVREGKLKIVEILQFQRAKVVSRAIAFFVRTVVLAV
jgi:carbonic anhydrase